MEFLDIPFLYWTQFEAYWSVLITKQVSNFDMHFSLFGSWRLVHCYLQFHADCSESWQCMQTAINYMNLGYVFIISVKLKTFFQGFLTYSCLAFY